MQLINYVDLFIGALISMTLCIYVIKIVFPMEKIKNIKTLILSLLFSSLILCIINYFNKDTFKILLTFPFVVLAIKNVYSIKYNKAIIYFIFSTLYMFIGEIIGGIVLSLMPLDYAYLFNNFLGTIFGNLIVVIFTVPLTNIRKLSNTINKIVENINENENVVITVFIILAMGAIAYKNLFYSKNTINLVTNVAIAITFLIIVYMYYNENAKSQELSRNYNEMFKYLEKYEKELVEKRKIIHDYKNQLIVINSYIGNDKKLKEYLDELINEQKNISENSIIKNIDKLPSGLKGLIYYKFSHIEKIYVDLQVLNSLKKFDKLSPKLNKQVLKIIGILIDNAIEAVNQEKEKYINIIFSIRKNNFEMKMINPCTKEIKTSNIMNIGFSTKGKNRGYGLALVKDILKEEKNISLNLNITNCEFISTLNVNI